MKTLTIDVAEVLKEPKGYRFYSWLAKQFNGSIFVEAGTCRGRSATFFSVNPTNLLITYDIVGLDERKAPGRVGNCDNVIFKKLDINEVNPRWLSKVDVLFVDISHNGHDEEKFLKRIEPHFRGILVMDDVDDKRQWGYLYHLFNNLKREHHLLPSTIGCTRGTGVVCYGDWTCQIIS